ncbi:hypothetical protein FACS189459_0140 [Bacilli bacterium]|nr:hypothetical protein FACS189459_0140 [Bacilli bacterium]
MLKKYNIVIDESLKNNSNPTIFNGVSFYSNIKKSETSDNIAKRINELKNELERSKNILSNQNFLSKASIDKISEEKNKQKKYQEEYDKLIDLV